MRLQFSLREVLRSLGDIRLCLTLETAGSPQVAQTSSDKPLLHLHLTSAHTTLFSCMLLHVRYMILHFMSHLFCVQLPEVDIDVSWIMIGKTCNHHSSGSCCPKALPFVVHSDMIQLCMYMCACMCVALCVGLCWVNAEPFKTLLKPL